MNKLMKTFLSKKNAILSEFLFSENLEKSICIYICIHTHTMYYSYIIFSLLYIILRRILLRKGLKCKIKIIRSSELSIDIDSSFFTMRAIVAKLHFAGNRF